MLKSPITTMFSYLFMANSINLVSSLKKDLYFYRKVYKCKDGPFSFRNIYFKTDDFYVLRLKSLYTFGWYALFYKKHEATPMFIPILLELPRVIIAVNRKLRVRKGFIQLSFCND